MEKRTKAQLLAWIEQHQSVTREKLLGAFEGMDYEQLQGWLSELQRKRKLFEVNPETYYTTIEPPEYELLPKVVDEEIKKGASFQ